MRGILGLFAKSPFGLMVKHTALVQETVQLLRPLFDALLADDRERLAQIYEEICQKEHEADETKNQVRDHIPKSVFLPVNRSDILLYVKEQDGIADAVEDVAVILMMRDPKRIPVLEPKLIELVEQVNGTAELLFQAAGELMNLVAASFSGPEVNKVLDLVAEVHGEEAKSDRLQAEFSKLVFAREDEIDPISIFQWMHIVQVLGDVADHAENTGDVLRLMVARA
ncbi:MAG: TIGR00153 family protein [Gemmatimonadota bacterium]|nr:MAG: TIGR00153 family protein [Gemmatimonadota bacterium]